MFLRISRFARAAIASILIPTFMFSNIAFADAAYRKTDTLVPYYVSQLLDENKSALDNLTRGVTPIGGRTARERVKEFGRAWVAKCAELLAQKMVARVNDLRGEVTLEDAQTVLIDQLKEWARTESVPDYRRDKLIGAVRAEFAKLLPPAQKPARARRASMTREIGALPVRHEVIADFTKRFLSGRLPDQSVYETANHTQLATQWVGVVTVAEGLLGAGAGLGAAEKTRIIDTADLRAQDVQGLIAKARGLFLHHINFETKGLTPGGLQALATTGDETGRRISTISDVIEHTSRFVEGAPGASSIQMEGEGAEVLGSFPDEARSIMVVTHIDRSLEAGVLKRFGVNTIEELLDPELPVDQLVHRIALLNGVSINKLDVIFLTNEDSDIGKLESLRHTYNDMRFYRITSGTVQPSIAACLGVEDGRVRLFVRRSGMSEAVLVTVFAGLFSDDGAVSVYRPVSEEIKSDFEQRYAWKTHRLEQLRALRADDWERIRDGRIIFSSRQVREAIRQGKSVSGAYTFLTDGRTDLGLPFNVLGVHEEEGDTYEAHALAFASNPDPDEAGRGLLWLSEDHYPYTISGQTRTTRASMTRQASHTGDEQTAKAQAPQANIADVRELTRQASAQMALMPEGAIDLSNIVVVMKKGLPEAITGRKDGALSQTLKSQYQVMTQNLRKTFAPQSGLIEVSTRDELSTQVNSLIARGIKVIVLDDGTLTQGLHPSSLQGKAGKDYCVVSADAIKDLDMTTIQFVNLNAMALIGLGVLYNDAPLFKTAYKLFTGVDAPQGLIADLTRKALWIVRALPRIVRFTNELRDQDSLRRLFAVAV